MVGVVVSFTKLYQYYDFKRFERMIWKIQAFLVLILGVLATSRAEQCYACLTSNPNNCLVAISCGEGVGCFSQTSVTNGTRYYLKGCRAPQIGLAECDRLNEAYCSLNVLTYCCQEDFCNAVDPVTIWEPQVPRNVVVADITTTSISLTWGIQCNGQYSYQVEYGRVGETATKIIDNIQMHQIQINDLTAGSYFFQVRSRFNGRISSASEITRSIPERDDALYIYCSTTFNSTFNSTSEPHTCLANQQRCSAILGYYTNGEPAFVTKSCATFEACESASSMLKEFCRPGVANSLCSFCCEGSNCNKNNDEIFSDLTCDGISHADRIDCGWAGITNETCQSRGCCFERNNSTLYDKWCFHKKLKVTLSESSPRYLFPYWIIIIVVAVVILLIILVVIVVICIRRKRRRNRKGIYNVEPIYAISNRRRRSSGEIPQTQRI